MYYWYDVIDANKMLHNELVLLVCCSKVDNMKQSNFIIELQYQYLNYITGIPVLYKILKKIHNTGKKNYTSDRQVQEIQII